MQVRFATVVTAEFTAARVVLARVVVAGGVLARVVVARGVLAGVVLVGGLAGCSAGGAAAQQGSGNRYVAGDGRTIVFAVADRKAAPSVTGSTLDGGSFDLGSMKGRVVVVNFWGSWCAPCRLEAADLEAVYQSTKDNGVTFVGVDSRDLKDLAVAFLAGRITYPSLFDPPGRVALSFRDVSITFPTTLIVDKAGKVAAVIRTAVVRADLTKLVTQIGAET
jgi:thiol-disulfide isomerase/thioredoxin